MSLVTGVIACAAVVTWAMLVSGETRTVLLLLLPVVPALLAIELVSCKLRLEERYRLLAGWQLLVPGGRLLVALTAVLATTRQVVPVAIGYGLVALAVAMLAIPSSAPCSAAKWNCTATVPRCGPPATPSRAKHCASVVAGMAVRRCRKRCIPIFFQVSTVMLKYLGGDSHAGRFGICMAVMAAIYLVPTTIYQKFLLSKPVSLGGAGPPAFLAGISPRDRSHALPGTVIGAALLLLMPPLVPIIFGEDYLGVIPVLMILALCPPIRFLSTAVGSDPAKWHAHVLPRVHDGIGRRGNHQPGCPVDPLVSRAGSRLGHCRRRSGAVCRHLGGRTPVRVGIPPVASEAGYGLAPGVHLASVRVCDRVLVTACSSSSRVHHRENR